MVHGQGVRDKDGVGGDGVGGDGVGGVGVGGDGVGGDGVGGDGVGEMVEGDLLLTLDCRQLQQSRLSSIPESRDLAKLVDNSKRFF